MFAAADKALLSPTPSWCCGGTKQRKPFGRIRMATKTGDYQVNPEYLSAYNNRDHHKDIYGAKARKDCSRDCALMIVACIQNMSHCFLFLLGASGIPRHD